MTSLDMGQAHAIVTEANVTFWNVLLFEHTNLNNNNLKNDWQKPSAPTLIIGG